MTEIGHSLLSRKVQDFEQFDLVPVTCPPTMFRWEREWNLSLPQKCWATNITVNCVGVRHCIRVAIPPRAVGLLLRRHRDSDPSILPVACR